jgi:hypothetical protein
MVAEGFRRCGQAGMADRVAGDTRGLIAAEGFSEYFDPLTGQGIGGDAFSWTAAIWLLLGGEES